MTATSESLSLQGGDGGDSLIIETRAPIPAKRATRTCDFEVRIISGGSVELYYPMCE
jgi:hypothetical protein